MISKFWIFSPFLINGLNNFLSVDYIDIHFVIFDKYLFQEQFIYSEFGDYSVHDFILEVDYCSFFPMKSQLLDYSFIIDQTTQWFFCQLNSLRIISYILININSNSNKGKRKYLELRYYKLCHSQLWRRLTILVMNQFHVFITNRCCLRHNRDWGV